MTGYKKGSKRLIIWIIGFLVANSLLVPLVLVGCDNLNRLEMKTRTITRTFKQLVKNKTYWAEQIDSYAYYTEGVVVYQTYREEMQFFVVVYPSVLKEAVEKESIIVLDGRDNSVSRKNREDKKKIEVGDIISVRGAVNIAKGTTNNGKKITVPYLTGLSIDKTGTVNIEDPNFEELVKIVAEQTQINNAAFQSLLIIIWGGSILLN